MRSCWCAIALSTKVFGLDEADQAMLLQTKHAVEKRSEQSDDFGPISSPINLDGAQIFGSAHNKIRNIKTCPSNSIPCPMWRCHTGAPACEPGPRSAYMVQGKLCLGECPVCHCPPPSPGTDGPGEEHQIAMGRPFSTDAGNLVSTADWKSGHSDWVPKDWNLTALTVSEDVKAFGENYWRTSGEHEHASVASFARASLDLMRFGAPPELLRDTHVAAMEEVRHAEISFGLATSFKGKSSDALVVGAFPLENAELSKSLDDFASKLLLEGCIGETSAVARLSYAISHINPMSPAAQHLVTLRDEEAGHAALAWKSLAWALSKGAKLPPLPEPNHLQRQEPSHAETEALVWTGAIPSMLGDQIDHSVMVATVLPWLSALSNGETELPAVSTAALSGGFADAVLKGSNSVLNRIQEIRI